MTTQPKGSTCSACGGRGCNVCDDTGSVFEVAGGALPNTLAGYEAACAATGAPAIVVQDDLDTWRPR